MRKISVIAAREYGAAVKTKAFIISLVLLPLMMGLGPIMERLTKKVGDVSEKRVAVIDRSGAGLYDVLERAAETRNREKIFDPVTKKQIEATFVLVRVEPSENTPEAMARQRFDLSERIRKNELFAYIEIGDDVIQPRPGLATRPAGELEDAFVVRYTSNSPTYRAVQQWAQQSLGQAIISKRIQVAGVPEEKVLSLTAPPFVLSKGLVTKDESGAIVEDKGDRTLVAFLLPISLLMLMFVIVVVGASPMTMNVVEEKQLRIAEVLLGSVRPFELMMGKLIGGAMVALTLAAIYLGGGYLVAQKYGMAKYVEPGLMAWFLLFVVLSVFMYGAMFVAVGAAVSNVKEAQSLITPVMIVIILPMMILGNLLTHPSGPVGMAATFFPLSAPLVTVIRMAIPPGIPAWQPLAAAGVAILTTIVLVWAAGRIFRVGILMQGQGAKVGEMLKWVVRG